MEELLLEPENLFNITHVVVYLALLYSFTAVAWIVFIDWSCKDKDEELRRHNERK
tara:strand:+ start:53 stop:217 length:165 start_codon:yes stop_codon:yes gene_type:complete